MEPRQDSWSTRLPSPPGGSVRRRTGGSGSPGLAGSRDGRLTAGTAIARIETVLLLLQIFYSASVEVVSAFSVEWWVIFLFIVWNVH